VAVVSSPDSAAGAAADHEIVLLVGPEVLAGSTRLKSGTAQKLVLNMVSTISMIRLGKTYSNLMVDVYASNAKLRARVRRIVGEATGASPEEAERALTDADGDAKVAIVAIAAHLDAEAARTRLEAAGGVVRRALES
jgi:N-acetylmuramic acid 6-phosphate etherase